MYYCAPLRPPSRGAAPRVPAGSHTAHPIADSHVMAMAPAQLNSKNHGWIQQLLSNNQSFLWVYGPFLSVLGSGSELHDLGSVKAERPLRQHGDPKFCGKTQYQQNNL